MTEAVAEARGDRRQRPGLLPSFAGVALADILANSVAIVIIMIVVTLMTRYEEERDKLEQAEDVSVLLSREIAGSFVMNSLPTSPPAQLHDYITSPLDRNPQHATMPILELHDEFVRDGYTGRTYGRDELLLQDNDLDRYLASLEPEQLAATRVDVYGIDQFYVAMSIFRQHGLAPLHWHFLAGGETGVERGPTPSWAATTRPEREPLDAAQNPPGAGLDVGVPYAMPSDVALARGAFDANYPIDSLSGGFGGRADRAGSQDQYFDLPRTARQRGGNAQAMPGPMAGEPGAAAESNTMRFRAAWRSTSEDTAREGEADIDLYTLVRGLLAFLAEVQTAADAHLPSPLPDYQLRRDVLDIVPELPPPEPALAELIERLMWLVATPRTPDEATVRVIAETIPSGQPQHVTLFPNEPLARVRWRRNMADAEAAFPRDDAPLYASVSLRLGLHAEIHEGLRVELPRNAVVVMPPPEPVPDPEPRWRVVTLVNPERNDFLTGFLFAAVDEVGALVLPADENALALNGLRLESQIPTVAFRQESRQLSLYAAIVLVVLLLFFAAIRLRNTHRGGGHLGAKGASGRRAPFGESVPWGGGRLALPRARRARFLG